MSHKFNDFELPGLYYFQAGNYFTGSRDSLNFKINSDGKEMQVMLWYGFLCSELAEKNQLIEQTENFPVTAEGHAALLQYLETAWKNRK